MSLRISCPACKTVLGVTDEARGRNVRCTSCGVVLGVPAAPPTEIAANPVPTAAPAPPPTDRADTAISNASPKPAPDSDTFAIATPTPAGATPSVKNKPPAKGKLPIAYLLAGGGAALALILFLCAGSIGAFFMFRSGQKPDAAKPVQQAQKTVQAIEAPKSEPEPLPEPMIDPNAGKPLPAQMPQEVMERVKSATVYLRVTRPGGGVSEGSGFFALQPGIVITNAHVLGMLYAGSQAPLEVQVTLNSGLANEVKLDGTVLGVDRQSDLGIVRIGASPFLPKPLLLENERKPFELQEIFIFGFPFGAQLGANITISKSSISSLRKKEIQVNGGMHPGNSGGPVVNSFGNVVGVAVSAIRGTTINFAIPAENVRQIMDGRLAEAALGSAYLQGDQPLLPLRLTCLDPLNRVRSLRVDVWAGAPGETGNERNEPRPPAPGDGPRQTHQIPYRDGVGALDVPLPPLPAGKTYWLQPSVLTVGGTQWEPAVALPVPFYPLQRKPAALNVGLTAQKEFTVRLKSAQSITLVKGKEAHARAWKIEADVLEAVSAHPKGALKRTAFGPLVVASDVQGKVTSDTNVATVLKQIPPAFIIDGTNTLQSRSDRGLSPKLPAALIRDVGDAYNQFCNSMEAVTVPMPNRALEAMESWQARIPMILRDGQGAEFAEVVLQCTYDGIRLRDKRREAHLSLRGFVQGRGNNTNKVTGTVVGRAALDLADGYIAQATLKISSDYDVQGLHIIDALDIQLDRAPGNPRNIPAPAAGPTPGLALQGKNILKVNGALAANDPVYPPPAFQEKNARMKVHAVMLQAGKTYAIALNSAAFDAYVALASPDGKVVAEDDDGGGGTNALIIYVPTAPGLYRITATAFDGKLGAYQLSVSELATQK